MIMMMTITMTMKCVTWLSFSNPAGLLACWWAEREERERRKGERRERISEEKSREEQESEKEERHKRERKEERKMRA